MKITTESTLLDPANLEGVKGKETRILGELLLSFPMFPTACRLNTSNRLTCSLESLKFGVSVMVWTGYLEGAISREGIKKSANWNFPRGLVVWDSWLPLQGHRFDLRLGNKNPTGHVMQLGGKKKIKEKIKPGASLVVQ